METKVKVRKRLSDFNIKPSLHRIAIMEYLMKHPTHPTVDTVYSSLSTSIPTLSKTTVYNILKLFDEKRAITEVVIDGKNVRYDADISEHAHFQCRKCGNVYDVRLKEHPSVSVENVDNQLIDECIIYFRGCCEACSKKGDVSA